MAFFSGASFVCIQLTQLLPSLIHEMEKWRQKWVWQFRRGQCSVPKPVALALSATPKAGNVIFLFYLNRLAPVSRRPGRFVALDQGLWIAEKRNCI